MKKILFLSLFLIPSLYAGETCVHLGDSQSSASPFARALQEDFAAKGYEVYTYARPSSRTSHWSDVAIADKQGPILTKGGFKFYPTHNSLGKDEGMTSLSDKESVPWAEKVFAHHKKSSPLNCVILQFGDNEDTWKSNQKLLDIVKKMKSETGKCFWVSPTWSEPSRGYSHMNDAKKIAIRKEIEKSLKGYDCQLISTTGKGDKVDYDFKEKLSKVGRYTSDGLHLNKAGGKLWADEVFSQIYPALETTNQKLATQIKEVAEVTKKLEPPRDLSACAPAPIKKSNYFEIPMKQAGASVDLEFCMKGICETMTSTDKAEFVERVKKECASQLDKAVIAGLSAEQIKASIDKSFDEQRKDIERKLSFQKASVQAKASTDYFLCMKAVADKVKSTDQAAFETQVQKDCGSLKQKALDAGMTKEEIQASNDKTFGEKRKEIERKLYLEKAAKEVFGH